MSNIEMKEQTAYDLLKKINWLHNRFTENKLITVGDAEQAERVFAGVYYILKSHGIVSSKLEEAFRIKKAKETLPLQATEDGSLIQRLEESVCKEWK